MKVLPTKRTIKRWAIGFGIILGLLLSVNAILAWRSESGFDRLVAAVRAEGDPASIAELAPPPIPDDQNAAALIDGLTPRLTDFENEYGKFYQTELGKQLDEQPQGELPSSEQAAAMQEILGRFADLEGQIRAASAAPRYASTADFSLEYTPFLEAQFSRLHRLRTIARFVDWRVQTLLTDGNQQEAIDWSLSLLELSAKCQSEPTVVCYLVTIATRNIALHNLHQSLAASPVDAATHATIGEALERLEAGLDLEQVFRTERALSISASIEQGWKRAPPVVGALVGWPIKRQFVGSIELYDEIIPLANLPYHQVEKEFQAGGKLFVPTGKGVLADLLVPSLDAAMQASSRDLALVRSLRVLNALQMAGDDAQGLDDIHLPSTATKDPFTGKPLVVKKTDGGWLVYSVGQDQTDDGGTFDKAQDLGFGPSQRGESDRSDE